MRPDFGHPHTESGAELPTPTKTMRVLDFDIENRPLAYWYDDKTTSEVTAIAWSWGEVEGATGTSLGPAVEVVFLKAPPRHEQSARTMLKKFRKAYDKADMVTGHYIRKHDLPILNAAMIEYGFGPMAPKLTSDTKMDLVSYGGQSASQMALANALDVKKEKPRMSVSRWRDANRLTEVGINATIERVMGDVRQHMELRQALLEQGMLKGPRMWTP